MERRRRFLGGVLGFVAAIGFVAVALVLAWPRWTVLGSAVPLTGGFLGYYQWRDAFCVGYAFGGVYNVDATAGDTSSVTGAEARTEDRRRAQRMLLQASVFGVLTAVVLYLLVPV